MSLPELATGSASGGAQPPSSSSPVRGALRQVPFRVSTVIPLNGLKLRDLRALSPGQIWMTEVSSTEDVPVLVGGALFGFAELDNMDGQMAIRLTRLS